MYARSSNGSRRWESRLPTCMAILPDNRPESIAWRAGWSGSKIVSICAAPKVRAIRDLGLRAVLANGRCGVYRGRKARGNAMPQHYDDLETRSPAEREK